MCVAVCLCVALQQTGKLTRMYLTFTPKPAEINCGDMNAKIRLKTEVLQAVKENDDLKVQITELETEMRPSGTSKSRA